MSDYISRDDVRLALAEQELNPEVWHKIDRVVYLFPAADVRPNVTGRWMSVKTGYICSNCKRHPGLTRGGVYLSNFCPNCGAKMEEKA